ncbi:3-methyl-2-oxobutanoate hydroxymethyltransferase [Psilocybe cubensis]|uniref:3-methyl-2-oxobutanoate hydroxymethyltransferase n=2 Tax=Psilocybe cubensis TaxID=181762 RepID=A0A8H7Y5D7_PSICU|nr:3-methyl-2-oxobutanoate hydroxymethyltransferase [Psilocybe cubensis]KAH9485735.1 3-methyl-2-oxobutanoate hydroxymethyltransferase [Psilocybe cubensis]
MSTTFAHRRLSHDFIFRASPQLRRWMSVRPPSQDPATPPIPRKKVTIQTLQALRQSKTPISMLTAYDYPSALACSSSLLTDITLVGDSLAQVCLGYASTTQLTLSEMIHHAKAAARGTTHPFLIADMPFGTYHTSVQNAVANAVRLVQEGRVEGVKLEGGREIADVVRRLTDIGIPVMAHVGLLPQRHCALSGYKVQGKSAEAAKKVVTDALALQEAGAFAVVVEAVPLELGKYITDRLKIPTIGIGAGPHTSGQVLVYDDVMGTWSGHKAKFVRRFGNMKEIRDNAVQSYGEAVREGSFPDPQAESYTMDKIEWARFLENEISEDIR